MMDKEMMDKELVLENEKLKKEINNLKNRIEKYREIEVELSTEIDLLREGIIEWFYVLGNRQKAITFFVFRKMAISPPPKNKKQRM